MGAAIAAQLNKERAFRMIIALFYVFSALILGSAWMVIASKSMVHSVLFLIFAFFNASGVFLLAGAEFLAMMLVIVYVGAVAVLFLFVVMMLDAGGDTPKAVLKRHLPLALVLAAVLVAEMVALVSLWNPAQTAIIASDADNTRAIAAVLYTDYLVPFQAAGLVLLVAMIGAIVLCARPAKGVRKQIISVQNKRGNDITLEKPPVGGGVEC
jgi:NADH-quinone oxidoreductase subunit J